MEQVIADKPIYYNMELLSAYKKEFDKEKHSMEMKIKEFGKEHSDIILMFHPNCVWWEVLIM